MRVVCLASGSNGNCLYVESDGVRLLVDAGIPARRLSAELLELGIRPPQLHAVLLTHEHSDHVGCVRSLGRRSGVPVVANSASLAAVGIPAYLCEELPTGRSLRIGCLAVTSFSLPHDARETVGYLIEADGARVLVATDLGYVPGHLGELASTADLVVLEANHDAEMLRVGPYPWFLKSRVSGQRGHLSNDDCAAFASIALSGRRSVLWLAHLSEVNNTPSLALDTVRQRLLATDCADVQVDVALRSRRSLVWDSAPPWQQLAISDG